MCVFVRVRMEEEQRQRPFRFQLQKFANVRCLRGSKDSARENSLVNFATFGRWGMSVGRCAINTACGQLPPRFSTNYKGHGGECDGRWPISRRGKAIT